MILNLKEVYKSGKESRDFFFLYEPDEELSTIPNVSVVLPVKINGTLTLTGAHSCLVEGEITFSLKGECSRCLKETEKEYFTSFSEEVSDGENGYKVINDTVDLGKIADDAILAEMPLVLLCDENCKGLCGTCGKDLNEGDCGCRKQ